MGEPSASIEGDERSSAVRAAWQLAALIFVGTLGKALRKVSFLTLSHDKSDDWGLGEKELLLKAFAALITSACAWLFLKYSIGGANKKKANQMIWRGSLLGYALFTSFFLISGFDNVLRASLFYVGSECFGALVIGIFFVTQLGSLITSKGKRWLGLIGVGGTLGAVGASTCYAWFSEVPAQVWCAIICLVGVVLAYGKPVVEQHAQVQEEASKTHFDFPNLKKIAALPLLRWLALSVIAYEVLSSLIDYQFTRAVLQENNIYAYVSTTYAIAQWLGLALQVLVASWALRRFSTTTFALMTPMILCALSLNVLLLGGTFVIAATKIWDSALIGTIHRTSRDVMVAARSHVEISSFRLYVDVIVERFAKVGASALILVLPFVGSSVEWVLPILATSAALTWLFVVFRSALEVTKEETTQARSLAQVEGQLTPRAPRPRRVRLQPRGAALQTAVMEAKTSPGSLSAP